MCLIPWDEDHCGCLGHQWPGVSHIVPCCNRPHIDQGVSQWPESDAVPSGPAAATPTSLA